MPKGKKTTKKFTLTISVDADVVDKYPNYRYNWDTPEEFIAHLVHHIQSDGKDADGNYSFGYRVEVEPYVARKGWRS